VVVAGRRRGPWLSGVLNPVRLPPAAGLLLPRDLGRERRKAVYIGRLGKGEWSLPGWPGTMRLAVTATGQVSLEPVDGDIAVDGRSISQPVVLRDGARLQCGLYEFRYENLFDSSSLDA
jgi:hypothetical protein